MEPKNFTELLNFSLRTADGTSNSIVVDEDNEDLLQNQNTEVGVPETDISSKNYKI
jgi:hypothetical protein